ncbi:glycoside hydrolase family 55 protein [Halogeometricum sp. S1BR25-6]|uniref:Glycoside hydrolase family 55 protein n=1 Tax=Halogeometricum salsisoli TaxID=2950536 RepID=A0ABU2GFR4_9EURY|nr:glycosyl hydrolase family 28-related protein [Halogeometricum sp. S1BR25-6]MDS0299650.1 glycoside hydrolase family 55 protein [Halogeometricum sp. S1BR25-6]
MVKKVTDFGAVGDGSRDDTDAIRNAADAAGPGGTVYFPPGTYLVGSDSRVPLAYPGDGSWDDLTWKGAGADEVTIKMAGGQTKAHFVFLVKGSQSPRNVTFDGLAVDGNKDQQSNDSVGLCVLTEAEGLFKMHNCRLMNAQNANLKHSGHMDSEITYSHFHNAGYVWNGGHGISPNQTAKTTTTIRKCLFTDQKGADVDVGHAKPKDWQTVLIENCVMRDSYRGSLKMTQENAKTTIRNTIMTGNSDTEIPVKANPSDASIGTVALENCIIDGGKFPGIDFPVPGRLELNEVAIKNVGRGGHRDGAGIYTDQMDVVGGRISVHGTDTMVNFTDSASGSIDEIIHESGISLGRDRGIVGATTVGSPLAPSVPSESEVGPGASDGADPGTSEPAPADPKTYGGYKLPEPGTVDWHVPLNENFVKIEDDVLELLARVQQLEEQH